MVAAGERVIAGDITAEITAATGLRAGKPSNTTRTNTTTATADPHLSVQAEANKIYKLRAFLIFTADTVPDMKIDFIGPSGTTWTGNATTFDATDAAGAQGTDERVFANGSPLALPGNGLTYSTQRQQTEITGVVDTAGTAGAFAVAWAQNTSSANNTVMHAGSWIELEVMA